MLTSPAKNISSLIKVARLLLSMRLDDPALTPTAFSFIDELNTHPEMKDKVLRFAPLPDQFSLNARTPASSINPRDQGQRAATILQWLIESAVYAVVIYDTSVREVLRLVYIDSLVRKYPGNTYLKNAYKKIVDVCNRSFNAQFAIQAHPRNDTLTPVLLYLPRTRQRRRLDVRLSFISVTNADHSKGVSLPAPISAAEEVRLLKIFFDFLNVYHSSDCWSAQLVTELVSAAYHITKNMPLENSLFLKERFELICAEPAEQNSYWKMFENTSHTTALESYLQDFLDDTERKAAIDFCLFMIALAIWYGKGPLWQKTLQRKIERLRNKYPDEAILNRIALFVLSIDFAFIRKDAETPPSANEHLSLLQAMRSIHPDTTVQALIGAQTWVRDSFAWLDEEYQLSLQSTPAKDQRGLLSEGGSIVVGSAMSPFAFVSREVTGGDMAIANLFVEAKKHGISVYTLPSGFSWTRNLRTLEDIALESTHIDTVINIIPADCTRDNRSRIIVDPCYYRLIKNFSGFVRCIQEQQIRPEDIIRIHPEEMYLNLANFSIILDTEGKKKLLFNKDKGLTIPRLNLKDAILVQPDIEIVNISVFNGNIRCVSNMFPENHIRKGETLIVTLQNSLPRQAEEAIISFFSQEESLIRTLLESWITKVIIRARFKQSTHSFDPLSRQISISLDYEDSFDAESTCRYLEYSIRSMCARFARDMGIPPQKQHDAPTEISLTIKNMAPQEQSSSAQIQGKILQFDSRALAV